MDSKKIIFLISQPRSGSTLLQKILYNHPDIATTSEPWICLPLLHKSIHENIKISKKVIYNNKIATNAINDAFFNNDFDKKRIFSEICYLLYEKEMNKQNKHFFLDKTPRYYYIIEELIKYFPESKIIILRRNPLNVLNSIIKTWVKKDYFLLSNYKDDLFLSLETFKKYSKNSNNIYNIHYEDLISDQKKSLKKLYSFLNIGYNEAFIKIKKDVSFTKGDIYNIESKHKINLPTSIKISNAQEKKIFKDYLEYLLKHELISTKKYNINEIENEIKKKHFNSFYPLFSLKFLTTSLFSSLIKPTIILKRKVIYKLRKIKKNHFNFSI